MRWKQSLPETPTAAWPKYWATSKATPHYSKKNQDSPLSKAHTPHIPQVSKHKGTNLFCISATWFGSQTELVVKHAESQVYERDSAMSRPAASPPARLGASGALGNRKRTGLDKGLFVTFTFCSRRRIHALRNLKPELSCWQHLGVVCVHAAGPSVKSLYIISPLSIG